MGLTDAEVQALCAQLKAGALPKLRSLQLQDNLISDSGMAAIAEAFGRGAMPNVKTIKLARNKVTDVSSANSLFLAHAPNAKACLVNDDE
eukprot:4569833-Prymnesium_polylepis.2